MFSHFYRNTLIFLPERRHFSISNVFIEHNQKIEFINILPIAKKKIPLRFANENVDKQQKLKLL